MFLDQFTLVRPEDTHVYTLPFRLDRLFRKLAQSPEDQDGILDVEIRFGL